MKVFKLKTVRNKKINKNYSIGEIVANLEK